MNVTWDKMYGIGKYKANKAKRRSLGSVEDGVIKSRRVERQGAEGAGNG